MPGILDCNRCDEIRSVQQRVLRKRLAHLCFFTAHPILLQIAAIPLAAASSSCAPFFLTMQTAQAAASNSRPMFLFLLCTDHTPTDRCFRLVYGQDHTVISQAAVPASCPLTCLSVAASLIKHRVESIGKVRRTAEVASKATKASFGRSAGTTRHRRRRQGGKAAPWESAPRLY